MTTEKMDEIISGYIGELKKNGIRSFSYSNHTLFPYASELTDEEYRLVEFISELLIIRSASVHESGEYLRSYIDWVVTGIQKDYEQEIFSFPPMQYSIDSVIMNNKRS